MRFMSRPIASFCAVALLVGAGAVWASYSVIVSHFVGDTEETYYSEGWRPGGCQISDEVGTLQRKTRVHDVWTEVSCPSGNVIQSGYAYVDHTVNGQCNIANNCVAVFYPPGYGRNGNEHYWREDADAYQLVGGETTPGICVPLGSDVRNLSMPVSYYYDVCPECSTDARTNCALSDGSWNDSTCQCQLTPIILDMGGRGLALTDLEHGVVFDLAGRGGQPKVSWTSAEAADGFLAMDRNANGKIDDGTELFGSVTDQPREPGRNGFKALTVLDQPATGGNGDGRISREDAAFAALLVWADRNHDGLSDPGELASLSSLGILSIDLDYRESPRTDPNGNGLRYRSRVRTTAGPRWAIDVYLSMRTH